MKKDVNKELETVRKFKAKIEKIIERCKKELRKLENELYACESFIKAHS